jgi:hypothetical protein
MGSGVESEAEAWERICALSIDCVAELEDMNACWQSTSNWSCDTSDGHPQTNGDCPSDTFFACLGPSLHERDPFGCVVTQEAHNAAAEDVGCTPDDMVEFTCTQLYLRDLCTSEWETLVECLTADEPANLFECDTDGSLARQDGVCENETDAYDACIAG